MKNNILSELLRSKFKKISTASIGTALYKRGLRNQFIQKVYRIGSTEENMVGQAYTLRYIPAREDRNLISVFSNSDHPQRVAMEKCPSKHVLVMDSRKNSRAASAGSILINRLMYRGVEGIVTDGGFRDVLGIKNTKIHCYHSRPSAPTNLTLHEAYDLNVPIGCGDAPVFPGDVIVGDQDGVIVIPLYLAKEIATECEDMEIFEKFVLEEVQNGEPIIGLYPLTNDIYKKKYSDWKKKYF